MTDLVLLFLANKKILSKFAKHNNSKKQTNKTGNYKITIKSIFTVD